MPNVTFFIFGSCKCGGLTMKFEKIVSLPTNKLKLCGGRIKCRMCKGSITNIDYKVIFAAIPNPKQYIRFYQCGYLVFKGAPSSE